MNGLCEIEAVARRWRGEALLTESAYAQAQSEFSRAAALANNIGRVRLQMDAQVALARLFEAQGQNDAAQLHGARAHAMGQDVESSLMSSGLEAQYLMGTLISLRRS